MRKSLFLLLAMFALPVVALGDEQGGDAGAEEEIKAGPDDDQEKVKPGAIDEDVDHEFKTTDSGLKYRILRSSDKEKANKRSAVTVHYKGWLDDKTIFDSSYRRGQKSSFPLNRVIPGWTEGMQLIGEGGMIELEIPAKIGYGTRGAPPKIPPNATLHFIVELFEIR